MKKFFIIFVGLILFSNLAYADSHLPIGILKIQEENKRIANETLVKVSFLIAFLAGITTIFSPCILPLLPAFFSYTFKERKKITKMTLTFFLGFAPVFVILGILAAFTGQTLVVFFQSLNAYVAVAGVILIVLGLMYFFGIGFRLFRIKPKLKSKGFLGILAYGALFGLGWIVCIGPILSGILLIASTFQNYFIASLLMLFYSLGVFFPLFLLSFFYDKYDLGNSKIMIGKEFNLRFFDKNIRLHSNNMIAGLLLIFIGTIFLVFRGTWIINGLTLFGLRSYFYSLQRFMLDNPLVSNIFGFFFLLILIYGIWIFVRKRGKIID